MTFIHAFLSPLPLGEGSGEGPQELAHPLTDPHPPPSPAGRGSFTRRLRL
jgi:hypothetical protein